MKKGLELLALLISRAFSHHGGCQFSIPVGSTGSRLELMLNHAHADTRDVVNTIYAYERVAPAGPTTFSPWIA
jgi:hypothetical protein